MVLNSSRLEESLQAAQKVQSEATHDPGCETYLSRTSQRRGSGATLQMGFFSSLSDGHGALAMTQFTAKTE